MVLTIISFAIAFFFFVGAIVAVIKARHFLAISSLTISIVFAKLANLKILKGFLRGTPNYGIVIEGAFLAAVVFFIDQWFFGKRNYSLKKPRNK